MNITNARKLVDHLKAVQAGTNGPVGFDMAWWFRVRDMHMDFGFDGRRLADLTPESLEDCGTTACIAGHAQLIGAKTPRDRERLAQDFAAEWLGLGDERALFYTHLWATLGRNWDWTRPDLDQAIELLELLIARETGEAA